MLKPLVSGLAVLLLASSVCAENWPTWRGPTSNGVATEGDYPTSWSDSENVLWKVKLDGRGASTPIVWGEQIFLTYGQAGKNVLACFNRAGKSQWSVEIGTAAGGKHKKASGSNPSCVTDGKLVYAYFKSGDVAAVHLNGKIAWQKNSQQLYGKDSLWWDLGTSPVLTKDNLIVTVMQTGPSYIAAFDKATGDVAWKVDRDVPAPVEAAQSYSTPVVATIDGREQIFVLGADHATAHDASNGKELWRVGGLNPKQNGYFRSISGPVLSGSTLIAPYARGGSVTAIRLGGNGDVTNSHVAWTKTGTGADVPTPTIKGDRIYICRDRGTLVALDVKSGEIVDSVQLEKNRHAYSASPILAGDHLYLTREDGKTFVVDTSDKLKVVASNEVGGEQTVATPVLVDSQILLRTYDHLYCIGKQG